MEKLVVLLLTLNISQSATGAGADLGSKKRFKQAVASLELINKPTSKRLKLTDEILNYRDEFGWSLLMHAVAARVPTGVFDALVKLMPEVLSEQVKQGLNLPMLAYNNPDLFKSIWRTSPASQDRWMEERNDHGNTALMMILQGFIAAPDSAPEPVSFFDEPEELDRLLKHHSLEPNKQGLNVYNLAYSAGLRSNLERIIEELDPRDPRSRLAFVNFVDCSSDQLLDVIKRCSIDVAELPFEALTGAGQTFLEALMYRHPGIFASLPNGVLREILRNHLGPVLGRAMSDQNWMGAFSRLVDEMHLRITIKMLVDLLPKIEDPEVYGRILRFARHHDLDLSDPDLVAAVAAEPSEVKRTLLLEEVPIESLVEVWSELDLDSDINPVFLKFKSLLLKSACLVGTAEASQIRQMVSEKKSPEVLEGFVRDVVTELNQSAAKREEHFNGLVRQILVHRSKQQLGDTTELECQNCCEDVAIDDMVFDGSGELPTYCRECLAKSIEMGAPLTDFDQEFELFKDINPQFMQSQGISGIRLEHIRTSRLKLELKKTFRDWRTCPNDSCFFGKVVASADDTHLECPICDTIICLACGKKHGGSCDEYEKSVEAIRAMIGEDIRPCPHCGTPIEKNHGCNGMTCANCNQQFHWNEGAVDQVKHDSASGAMAWQFDDRLED